MEINEHIFSVVQYINRLQRIKNAGFVGVRSLYYFKFPALRIVTGFPREIIPDHSSFISVARFL